ncbi:MAG: hypothetical protein U9Q90_01470, partial [Campylobacterota bacterium]|nr:hypothetical protein [Campylobacterota bacterium]
MKKTILLGAIASSMIIGSSALVADDLNVAGTVNVTANPQPVGSTRTIYPAMTMAAADDPSILWSLGAGTDTDQPGLNAVGFINLKTLAAPLFMGSDAADALLTLSGDKIIVGGKLGVGTESPTEAVDVVGTDAAARFKLTSITNTGNQAAQYVQQRARSESGSPAAVESGDVIGMFSFRGWHGSGWTGTKAGITVTATEDWSTSSNGNLVTISHTPNGSSKLTPALQIKGNADVYIPNGNLYVKGKKMSVPDYVFKDDYKLMPLDELKTFIKKNNHLPGVASADEVGKAGVVNLSGLQMTLLEKVE